MSAVTAGETQENDALGPEGADDLNSIGTVVIVKYG
jgi:hypothetical protein